MKKLTLGYCPIGNGHSIYPFNALFAHTVDISKTMEGVDAVVFWGGADIHPSLYGETAHPYTQAGVQPSPRDVFEWKAMNHCKVNNIPMIGVCRGAQLMCAFAGGFLVQDTNNHHREHLMMTSDGEIISTTSCHHQMMYPYNIDHEMLAWSHQNRGTKHDGSIKGIDVLQDQKEPEVVYFPEIRGLAIQGHPEWATPGSRFATYCNALVQSKLLAEVSETN